MDRDCHKTTDLDMTNQHSCKNSRAQAHLKQLQISCSLPDPVLAIVTSYNVNGLNNEQEVFLLTRKYDNSLNDRMIDLLLESPFINVTSRLAWQDVFWGSTGYIDSIRASHMCEPIMWGVDSYDRLFVALRTRIANLDPEASRKIRFVENVSEFEWDQQHVGVETVFQRYSEGNTWASGSHGGHHLGREIVTSSMKDVEFENLKQLMTTGETTITRSGWVAWVTPAIRYEEQQYCLTLV